MLDLSWPAVMGILNVTPDSFSDGGRYVDPHAAVEHGLAMADAGAAVIDVGGESTRPGAGPVPPDEQVRRVVPVIAGLVAGTAVPVSVDTSSAVVAGAALAAGAVIVNDTTAGRGDPGMFPLVAATNCCLVLMHMAGTPATMQCDPRYDDVVAEVGAFLAQRRAAAADAGIDAGNLLVDPGLGFGKTVAHNTELLARLPELIRRAGGGPMLLGPSRKGFLGCLGAGLPVGGDGPPGVWGCLWGRGAGAPAPLPVGAREEATLAAVVWAFEHGAAMVRVHEVAPAALAARLLTALAAAAPADPDPPVSWRPPEVPSAVSA